MAGDIAGVWALRPTVSRDEEFLWTVLFYASHSNDEPGVAVEDLRDDPDLVGYIEGWKALGRVGVIADSKHGSIGAAWLRELGDADSTTQVFVDPQTPELAMAVLPGREGMGIGTAMLDALLGMAQGRFPAIVLSVRRDNPAVGLYERAGFMTVGEITNRVGSRSARMVLDLGASG